MVSCFAKTVENVVETADYPLLSSGCWMGTARRRCCKGTKRIKPHLSHARGDSLVCKLYGVTDFYPLSPLTPANVAGGSS